MPPTSTSPSRPRARPSTRGRGRRCPARCGAAHALASITLNEHHNASVTGRSCERRACALLSSPYYARVACSATAGLMGCDHRRSAARSSTSSPTCWRSTPTSWLPSTRALLSSSCASLVVLLQPTGMQNARTTAGCIITCQPALQSAGWTMASRCSGPRRRICTMSWLSSGKPMLCRDPDSTKPLKILDTYPHLRKLRPGPTQYSCRP